MKSYDGSVNYRTLATALPLGNYTKEQRSDNNDAAYGEFILTEEHIYLDSEGKFISLDFNGENSTVLRNQSPLLTTYTAGEGVWIGVAYEEQNVECCLVSCFIRG